MNWIDANTFFGSWHRRRLDVPPAELVRLLEQAGTARAATCSLMAPLLEAEDGNRETLQACAKHEELIPMGVVDPRKFTMGDAVARVCEQGFAAVRLTNGINEYPLDISPVHEILRECAKYELTAFVDVLGFGLATACERLADATGARVVMLGLRYFQLSEAIVSMKRCDRLYVEISKLNTPDAIRATCDEVGASRVLHGSGAPFNYALCARAVAEHNHLSSEELEWVASKTFLSLVKGERR